MQIFIEALQILKIHDYKYYFLNFESWSRIHKNSSLSFTNFTNIQKYLQFHILHNKFHRKTKEKNRKSSSNSDYSNGKCSRPFSTSYVTTWNSTCLAEILESRIHRFFFFFFLFSPKKKGNLHISTFPWILRFTSGLKLTMLPPLLPLYFTILFSPREVCHALIDFQQTAIEPVSFRGYPFRIWSYLSIECCIDVVQCGLFSFFFFRLLYQRYRIEITSQDGLLKDG